MNSTKLINMTPIRESYPWDELFDKAEGTILQTIHELPIILRNHVNEKINCGIEEFHPNPNAHILGIWMKFTNGPIIVYVGQIYEDCHQNIDETMKSVRQVYLHELAHAVGDLAEYEVKERGL